MKWLTKITLLFALMPAAPGVAYGDDPLLAIQRSAEERASSLVRFYDPQGFAMVELVARKTKSALPGVPFYYDNYLVEQAEKPEIERLEVTIVSRLKQLPPDAVSLVEQSLKPISNRVQIRFKQIVPAAGTQAPPAEVRLSLPQDGSLFDSLFKSVPFLLSLGLFLILGCAIAGSLVVLSRGIRAGMSDVSAGLGGMKESFQGGPSRAAPSVAAVSALSPATSASWNQLPVESVIALLGDCYWCEKDGYAAFVWSQISITQRVAVVASWPVLEKYVRHVQNSKAEDLGLHNDVNYLSPLAIQRLNNKAVLEQVKLFPAVLRRLSPLRSDHLEIGVQERVVLQEKAKSSNQFPDWAAMKPSEERRIQGYPAVHLVSDARETEVLSLKSFPLEAKEQFVSIAWMVQLPRERVVEVLDGFSARELAQAWVGPASLLQYLGECLAPKKRELVLSYRESASPSRQSEAYARLHRAAIEAFRKGTLDSREGGAHAKAA